MAARCEPLVCFHPAEKAAERAQALLAEQYRPVAVVPDDGSFSVWARGGGCEEALRLARALPARAEALVLEAPAVVPEGEALRVLTVPTLVVCGTDGQVAAGRVYREQMPNCHLVLVYAAGDDIANQRPEAFASLVSDFLTRRERFIVNQRSGLLHP